MQHTASAAQIDVAQPTFGRSPFLEELDRAEQRMLLHLAAGPAVARDGQWRQPAQPLARLHNRVLARLLRAGLAETRCAHSAIAIGLTIAGRKLARQLQERSRPRLVTP